MNDDNEHETSAEFQAAAAFVSQPERGADAAYQDSATQLQFYGLYKQATQGPVQTSQPSFLQQAARAKWKAWNDVRDLTREEAEERYMSLVTSLSPTWKDAASKPDSSQAMGPVVSRMAADGEIPEDAASESKKVMTELIHSDLDEERWIAALERKGLDAHVVDADGQTVLHWAADHGIAEAIDLFVNMGMDVNVTDNDGMTPLHCAAASDHRETAMRLIAHGARMDIGDGSDVTPLDLAPPEWREDPGLAANLQAAQLE